MTDTITRDQLVATRTGIAAALADVERLTEDLRCTIAPERVTWRLTPREVDVLQLMATGCTKAAAARQLGMTEHTAKTHMLHAFAKLEARSMAHAVAIAMRAGVIS